MIVAKIEAINFKQNEDVHTIGYAKVAGDIADRMDFSGTLKQVVAKDLDAAIIILLDEVRTYLRSAFSQIGKKVYLSDFTMEVMYEHVQPDGRFWPHCAISGPEIALDTGEEVK